MPDRQEVYNKILSTLDRGGMVQVVTYTRCTNLQPKHRDMIKFANGSIYLQHGKRWDCIDYCGFKFWLPKPKEN